MKEIELSVNKYTHVYPTTCTGTSIIIFSTTVIFQRRVSKKNSTSTETYLNLYTRCGSMYICWYVYAPPWTVHFYKAGRPGEPRSDVKNDSK